MTNNAAIKIKRSRVLRISAKRRHKPDLFHALVEIDVGLIGQSSTYVFNCVARWSTDGGTTYEHTLSASALP